MNNSLEYMKKRIQEGNCKNMPPQEFEQIGFIPFRSFAPEDFHMYKILCRKLDDGSVIADMTYSPKAEFNYFVTETCVCDGTLAFMYELAQNVLQKIVLLETCYAPAIEGISKEDLGNDLYAIHYEVGDFVTNSYMTEIKDEKKPWMCDRFTVMLPVRFTIQERSES